MADKPEKPKGWDGTTEYRLKKDGPSVTREEYLRATGKCPHGKTDAYTMWVLGQAKPAKRKVKEIPADG